MAKISTRLRIRRWRGGIKKYKAHDEALFKPINPEIEKKHIKYWSKLYKNVNPSYLRMYSNFSDIHDYRYVPDDIFTAIIDRILNNVDYALFEINKNYYERYLDKSLFPKTFLRKDFGQFLDENYNFISKEEAENIFNNIKRDFICKATRGRKAKCGRSIKLFKYEDERKMNFNDLDNIYGDNYIIQEHVKQNAFFAQFNPSSFNNIRIVTYRSVKDNKIHVLKTVLKIGRIHQVADNSTLGGLCNNISPDGKLSDFSILNLKKYDKHPDSKIEFKNKIIPHFQKILDVSKKAAAKIICQRYIGFDVGLDANNEVKIIEINTVGTSGSYVQLQGGPLFGEFTDEVLNYCTKNLHKNEFSYLRM
ncbi:hypothetical protein KKF04_00840 [Patescibacteria group bacterium]|nr:hypothetical protein [Patescibacteria group bacterium]MBU1934580.1 hypothetical protein [Patescibacteria group bacterium]